MAYQKTVIPFVKGIDESVSEQIRAPERLTDVINGRFDKQGAIVKRGGFVALTGGVEETSSGLNDTSNGPARGIFSTGDDGELCVIGGRKLYARNPTHGYWYDRGLLSPFTGKLERIFSGQSSYESADICLVGDYVMMGAQARRKYVNASGSDVSTYDLVGHAESTDGLVTEQVVLATTTLDGSRAHSVRCATVGTKGLLYYLRDGTDSPNAPCLLRAYEWDSTDPHNGFSTIGSIKNDVFYFETGSLNVPYNNRRSFDLVGLANGTEYLIAWIDDSDRDIYLDVLNASHVSQRNTSTVEDVYWIAAADDDVNDRLYVAVWSKDGTGELGSGNELRLYAYEKSSLGLDWGPVVFDTLGSNELPGGTLGVCKGTDELGIGRVTVVWSIHQTLATGNINNMREWAMHSRSCSVAGNTLSQTHTLYNVVPTTRPWSHRGRFFCAATSHSGKHHFFGYSAIYDLFQTSQDAGEPTPRIAGLYDIGVAPCLGAYGYGGATSRGGPLPKGSLNSVVQLPDTGKFRFMSISMSEVQPNVERQPKCSADMVELDYDGVVTADTVFDGSAIIGGGFVAYYDSVQTCELGFPVPPLITELDSVNDGGAQGPTGTTYYGLGVWYYFDSVGSLHRSMPSPAEQLSHTTTYAVEYAAFTYPGSLRDASKVNAVFFRSSDSDVNFRQVNKPLEVIPNSDAVGETAAHHEADANNNGAYLYTNVVGNRPGVLENVSPEGASIVRAGIDRIWLGGFFRRDRLQFSKPPTPGSAAEFTIAPEFNEAFQRLIVDGKRVTGFAEHGDRLLVFTPDEIYWIGGDGPDDGGAGSDYPPLTLITTDTGCTDPRTIVNTPVGVMFQGRRGIYTLTRADDLEFTGFAVIDQTDVYNTITSASLNASTSEVYFTCNSSGEGGQILVYNYAFGTWSRWVVADDLDSSPVEFVGGCMHNGTYYVIGSGSDGPTGTVYQHTPNTYTDPDGDYISTTVETGWFTGAEQGGWRRVRRALPMMTRENGFALTVDVFYDYKDAAARTVSFTGAQIAAFPNAKALQPDIRNSPQKCTSVKYRITDSDHPLTSGAKRGYTISGLMLEWMPRRGANKTSEAAKV